jgi:hypothetical protein
MLLRHHNVIRTYSNNLFAFDKTAKYEKICKKIFTEFFVRNSDLGVFQEAEYYR